MEKNKLSTNRRTFLKVGLIAGGGLALGIGFTTMSTNKNPITWSVGNPGQGYMSDAWITLRADNSITITVNHSEMGQGITTALPMMVAEELDADWTKIDFAIAPVADIYKHPHYGLQWTVSSRSVESSFQLMRKAGAAMRQLMLSAAAKTWNVPVTSCRTHCGKVHHSTTNHSLTYGELLATAATLPLPEDIPTKDPAKFKLLGQPLSRLDTQEKIRGSAIFGIDVRQPQMLVATVVHPPVFGAKPASYNDVVVEKLPGIRKVVPITTGLAIVAETFWQTQKAREALQVKWQPHPLEKVDSDVLQDIRREKGKQRGKTIYSRGEGDKAFQRSAKIVEAIYELPHQAHATPEPMNCTAWVNTDSCTIWAPTQNQEGAQDIAAKITGLPAEKIAVHTTYLGGGFGRRALVDYVGEAVELSRIMQVPVKVIWTREEDIRRDFYRPSTSNILKAVIDDKGRPLAWLHRIVGADVFGQVMPQVLTSMLPNGVPHLLKNVAEAVATYTVPKIIPGKKAALGAAPLIYGIPDVQIEFIDDDPGIPTGWWRSVAHSSNCFAVECFIDEIAAASGYDPFILRCQLLSDTPRLLNALQFAALKAEWGMPKEPNRYHGMACHDFQNTMMAMIAEISIESHGRIIVHRIDCAVDCGLVINPKIIEAQIESAVAFGLTATLKGEITIKNGAVVQSNFHDFPLLRYDEMPEIHPHIIPSTLPPTGIGEAAVSLVAPAVANGVFAATGHPVHRLPISISG